MAVNDSGPKGGRSPAASPGAGPPRAVSPPASAPKGVDAPSKTKELLQSAPKVEMPKGGGAMRGIGEKFQANPVTGTAAFTVPLSLSPGRGGSTPPLTLSYDSGAGNGPFGMGWSLSLPSIKRKTDRGLPEYQDARDSDTFVLADAEDLVPYREFSGGSWADKTSSWEDEDSVTWGIRWYRPRVEAGFARIERWTHPTTKDVHWRTISRENVTRVYGASASARVADPDDASRVFQWLLEEERDEVGNVTRYEYDGRARDAAVVAIYERNRGSSGNNAAYAYLKRVSYGNVTPFTGDDGFYFEVVFDYGDHTASPPTRAADSTTCPARPDVFSNYRARFDVRCARLCRRVLVFHRFPTGAVGDASLVRSTELSYDESVTAVVSTLTSILVKGHRYEDASWTTEEMPALEFGYSEAAAEEVVQFVDLPGLVGQGMDMSRFQWVDLDAEGMAGLLGEQGSSWHWIRNEGMGTLGEPVVLRSRPGVSLQSPTTRLMDIDGDGRTEVVSLQPGMSGSWARTRDRGWEAFRPFRQVPTIDWNDPDLRMLDLDGDGIADLLLCRDEALTWYPSEGSQGWDQARRAFLSRDEEKGPTAIYANHVETILLADMTGDGLTDLVRVRNGSVCYWPNKGYGKFGAKVQMKDSPWFDSRDRFDPRRVRLADIDGTGPADLIYLGPTSVRYWINRCGNSYMNEAALAQLSGMEDSATVTVADLLGNGTQCIVWASPLSRDGWAPLRFIELMAEGKPYLLTSITNNLGRTTRLSYAPSTQFYVDDRASGSPWATRLPFPVQCLEEVEERDHVSGWRRVQTFAYHHGYYDTAEREFRGFAAVDQRDAETFSDFEDPALADTDIVTERPPVLKKTWFHVGAWRDQAALDAAMSADAFVDTSAFSLGASVYADATSGWPSASASETREFRRALKGKVLREELYAEDGSASEALPYTVARSSYAVTRLQAKDGDIHAVFRVDARETATWHYERDTSAPRVEHALVLATDAYGNVTRSAKATYPRRSGSSATEETTGVLLLTEASFAYDVAGGEVGPGEAEHWHPGVSARTTTWHVTGVTVSESSALTIAGLTTSLTGAAEIDWDVAPTSGVQKRRIATQLTTYFNDDADAELAEASIGVRALVYARYARALTASQLTDADALGDIGPSSTDMGDAGYVQRGTDTGWWVASGTRTLDDAAFYVATSLTDAFGNSTAVTWDDAFLFVATVTDALLNVVTAEHDYQALQPNKIIDPNGNWTRAWFDALGRVTAIRVVGKAGEGEWSDDDTWTGGGTRPASAADPTTSYTYELDRWSTDEKPVRVHVRTRETHADSGTCWYDRYTYSDGGGNVVQEKVNAEPGTAYEVISGTLTAVSADPRWVGTGRTVLDNKGSPVKQYEPFFSTTEEFDDEKDLVEWGVTPIISYDPIGRATMVTLPNGTLRKIAFDPWSQTTWDENDSVNDSECTASSALKALAVGADTPTVVRLDVQGRVYATEETLVAAAGSTPATTYVTTLTLDVAGNVTDVTVQRENSSAVVTDYSIQTSSFDMLGRPLKVVSPDGGTMVAFLDAAGQPLEVKLGAGVTRTHAYDALRRETLRTVTDGSGTRVTDAFEYGEDATDPEDSNLRGKPWRNWHKGGRDEVVAYDFKGNPLSTTRRYWDRDGTSSDTADWTTLDDTNLESDTDLWLTTEQTYDALNRVTSQTAPDGAVTEITYNEAGLFETAEVDGDPFVEGVSYNARGQRESVAYGNGTSTAYTYEAETFRLATLVTTRASDSKVLQSLTYTYDPVGNIRTIVNAADDTVFFDNVAVSPNQAFTYDAFYRLKTATGREKVARGQPYNGDPASGTLRDPYTAVALYEERYVYDAVGNITEMRHLIGGSTDWVRAYAYEEDGSGDPVSNRLVDTTESVGTVTYQHDDRGNVVFLPHLYNDGATPDPSPNVEYDDRGQMVRAQLNSTDYALYYYDSAGQRVRKVVVKGAVVEDRRYANGFEVWRKSSSGTLTEERTTLHVMDGEKRIAMVEKKTVGTSAPLTRVRYQLGNHIGTSVLEVNEDGDVISYEEFHPYGSTAWWTNDGDTEVSHKRYRYTGKEKDEETGLYYHGARYYAPWLGRWTSADPIGLGDGPNTYAYVHGGPIGGRDPTGLQEVDPRGAAAESGVDPVTAMAADDMAMAVAARNRVAITGIRDRLMSEDPENYALRTLVEAFNSSEIMDDGTVSGRLEAVLNATAGLSLGNPRELLPGMHFGIAFDVGEDKSLVGRGDSGFASTYQDPWEHSRNQVGHFLTGVRLAYDPSFLDFGAAFGTSPARLAIGAPTIEQESAFRLGVKLSVGHELAPDLPGVLSALSATRSQYAAASDADVENFLSGNLTAIRVDESVRGNSNADIALTYQAYTFAAKVASGEFASNAAAAEWLRTSLGRF